MDRVIELALMTKAGYAHDTRNRQLPVESEIGLAALIDRLEKTTTPAGIPCGGSRRVPASAGTTTGAI
jgi:hypothetical protein